MPIDLQAQEVGRSHDGCCNWCSRQLCFCTLYGFTLPLQAGLQCSGVCGPEHTQESMAGCHLSQAGYSLGTVCYLIGWRAPRFSQTHENGEEVQAQARRDIPNMVHLACGAQEAAFCDIELACLV